MKKHLLFTAVIGVTSYSQAQLVEDSIAMLPGYTNESYYSMSDGEQANIDNTNWDLAFDLSGFGASIRTNEHTGTKVYVYQNGTDWNNVDTTGMNWNALHNSETSWAVGSLDQTTDPANPMDIGWGIYNSVTHQILGESIHILQLSNGEYRKLMIESLIGGVYTFKHAMLNGTNEITATVTKNNFTSKNFAYYSVTNNTVLDREPTSADWDIVFTKYVAELSPGVYYGVTGVLSNKGVYVREASGIDPTTAVYTDYTIDSVINVIGWDWKSFNSTTFQYDIPQDLSYFVQDQTGDIWQLVFTRFEGSASGKVVFAKERVSMANLEDMKEIASLAIYPNPAKEHVSIMYNSSLNTTISIVDMTGKTIFTEPVEEHDFIVRSISLEDFSPGTYFIQVATPSELFTEKLIVH